MQADDEIANRFAFLETEHGFRCVDRTYDSEHFGNAIVEYESARLRVRVIKDRGQFFCDFAAPTESIEWFDQEIVFRDLGEDAIIDALIAQEWSSLEDVARSVHDSLDRIVNLFSERNCPRSVGRFQELQGRRVRELFGDEIANQILRNRNA